MIINTRKLYAELVAAGIETAGCDCTGTVWGLDNNEIQDRKDVRRVIKAHDSTPTLAETLEEKIKRIVKEELNK